MKRLFLIILKTVLLHEWLIMTMMVIWIFLLPDVLSPIGFGEIPNSYLLENDGQGNFSLSDQPHYKNAGMVTDAVWRDFNGDQITDLILVGEWMSPQFFQQRKWNLDQCHSKIPSGKY